MSLILTTHLTMQSQALLAVASALKAGTGCSWFADVPLEIKSVANLRQHWGAKHRDAQRAKKVGLLVIPNGRFALSRQPRLQWVFRLVRVAPRELDSDNLASAFKALRDGIAKRLGVDDRDSRVCFVVDQAKGKQARVRIEAYHVPASA